MFYEAAKDVRSKAPLYIAAHRARLADFHAWGTLLMAGPFASPEEGALGIFTTRKGENIFDSTPAQCHSTVAGKVLSLPEIVKHFRVDALMRTMHWLDAAEGIGNYCDDDSPLSENVRNLGRTVLPLLARSLAESGLSESAVSAERLLAFLNTETPTYRRFKSLKKELVSRLEDGLMKKLFFVIEPGAEQYLEKNLFGPEVTEAFPSARDDIEAGGRCLALDRYTATVFHLMRVMEVGLRVLAVTLNDDRLDPKRNPTWDTILKKGRDELAKPLAQRSPEWAADDAFFSGATATLMAVKDAWRNPTMHVERNYDPDQAVDVWSCVRAFMRQLATRLHE